MSQQDETQLTSEIKPDIDGVSEKLETTTSEVIPTIPDAPDKTKLIQDILQKKVDQGLNLSDKSIYTRIYKEIAEETKCSYQNVVKVAKKFLNKSSQVSESILADKNEINVKTVSSETRPAPKPKPVQEKPITILSAKEQTEIDNLELKFSSDMVMMSFENIADFLKSLEIPAPKMKKIKQMAGTIALYNQKVTRAGHPEKIIDVGEKYLGLMIKIGIIGMFGHPIAAKIKEYLEKRQPSDGVQEKTESME